MSNVNIGPEYYVDRFTSLVNVDTLAFTSNSTAVVYLSSVSIPGRIVSIRDSTGGLSLNQNKFITVSTSKDISFQGNAFVSTITFNQPYGFVTCTNQSPSVWAITNTYAFEAQSTPIFTQALNTLDLNTVGLTVSQINASTITTKNLFLQNDGSNNDIFGNSFLTNGTSGNILTNRLGSGSAVFVQRRTYDVLTPFYTSSELGELMVFFGSFYFKVESYRPDLTIATGDNSIFDWFILNPRT